MKKLSVNEYQQLRQNAQVLAEDGYGEKVLLLSDQTIIKLFRVKRMISSAVIYSPARRFANNATKLQQLGIPTVSILALYKIRHIKRTAVHYEPLAGVTVREHLQSGQADESFLQMLGQFLARLHQLGIYFRSAHFGNIVLTPNHQLGLIDISDMKIQAKPLSTSKRLRNLKHIFRLPEDIQLLENSHAIEESYLQNCSIKQNQFQQQFLSTCEQLRKENIS